MIFVEWRAGGTAGTWEPAALTTHNLRGVVRPGDVVNLRFSHRITMNHMHYVRITENSRDYTYLELRMLLA